MSRKIILTAKNYDSAKSQFIYTFPIEQNFDDEEVAVTQFNMFNSFYNISKAIGNNTITIGVPNASGTSYTYITSTVPDGFYDTNSFNIFLQSIMYDNNLYYKLNGIVTYYLSLDLLATQYKNALSFYNLSGVTLQSGVVYSSTKNIYLNFNFGMMGPLFGFSTNTSYGPAVTTISSSTAGTIITKSNLVPQINPFNSLIVTCSLINNIGLCDPPDYLFSCALSSEYGGMLEVKKLENVYMKCSRGFFKTVTLTIYDNNFNKLSILDNNSLFVLTFRKAKRDN